MTDSQKQTIEQIRQHIHHHVASIVGDVNPDGYEIYELIHILSNLQEAAISRQSENNPLSGARLGILVQLMEEEQQGSQQGLTPSQLSRQQNVSRNTVSVLLRGLEEQGFIERKLDEADRRTFHIHISAAGRQAVYDVAPRRITMFNRLVSGLDQEEQKQLIELLGKLFVSVQANSGG